MLIGVAIGIHHIFKLQSIQLAPVYASAARQVRSSTV